MEGILVSKIFSTLSNWWDDYEFATQAQTKKVVKSTLKIVISYLNNFVGFFHECLKKAIKKANTSLDRKMAALLTQLSLFLL